MGVREAAERSNEEGKRIRTGRIRNAQGWEHSIGNWTYSRRERNIKTTDTDTCTVLTPRVRQTADGNPPNNTGNST